MNGQPDRIFDVVLSPSTYYSDTPGGSEENLDRPISDVLPWGQYLHPGPATRTRVFKHSSQASSCTNSITDVGDRNNLSHKWRNGADRRLHLLDSNNLHAYRLTTQLTQHRSWQSWKITNLALKNHILRPTLVGRPHRCWHKTHMEGW
jgi:hypothetical protein